MFEENVTAKTSEGAEGAQQGDPHAEVAGEQSSAVFTDGEQAKNAAAAEQRAATAPAQSKEQRSEHARRRREAERAREMKEVREKAILEALGNKNPYTGEEMKDSTDIEEFLMMREVEKSGGDPVGDLSGFRKKKEREQLEKERTEREKAEWYQRDRDAFLEKHPGVSLDELVSDEAFRSFAEGKVGEKPLAEIYENYLAMTSAFEQRAKATAAQIAANAKASPGALSGGGAPESEFFTKEQVKAMTPAQIDANFDKIRRSMDQWGRS